MKIQLFAIVSLAVAASLISCAAAPTPSTLRAVAPSQSVAGLPPPAPVAPGVADQGAKAASGTTSSSVPNGASAERMIVRTVQLGLEVQDTDKAYDDIGAIVSQFKGYVAQTNRSRDSKNRLVGTVTIRIPAESLDAALKQIKSAGLKVLNENTNANDVTDQYTDLNARLTNLQATEVDLRKMMDAVTAKSSRAEDILAIYNQLTQIRTQIEQLKGQINLLDRTTSLATVTITLTPHDDVQILEPDTWAPNRTVAEAARALIQALQGIVNLGIWFVIFILPVLIILALPFVLFIWIVRSWLRRRAKKKVMAA